MLDLVILAILALGAYNGWKRGFLMTLFSLLAVVLGVFLAFSGLEWFLSWLKEQFPNLSGSWLPYVAFFALFIGVFIGTMYLGRIVKRFLDFTLFGRVDDFLGAAVSVLKTAFLLSIAFWLSSTFGLHLGEEHTGSSRLLPYIIPIGPFVSELLVGIFPFGQDLFEQIKDFAEPSEVPAEV